MRIVGGKRGGQRLAVTVSDATRPTSDRVREALASVLDSRGAIEGAIVLDLYAGTGALAFEMLSRGASEAVCVEAETKMAQSIHTNAARLDLPVTVLRMKLAKVPSTALIAALKKSHTRPSTLVFADPPYAGVADAVPLISALRKAEIVDANALIVIEHASRDVIDPRDLAIVGRYRYGDTSLTLLEFAEASS